MDRPLTWVRIDLARVGIGYELTGNRAIRTDAGAVVELKAGETLARVRSLSVDAAVRLSVVDACIIELRTLVDVYDTHSHSFT